MASNTPLNDPGSALKEPIRAACLCVRTQTGGRPLRSEYCVARPRLQSDFIIGLKAAGFRLGTILDCAGTEDPDTGETERLGLRDSDAIQGTRHFSWSVSL